MLRTHRWLDKVAKACREGDEEFRACPKGDCNWGCFFSTKDDGNIFTCQVCEYRYCVVCETTMHEGETCEQYKQRLKRTKEKEARNEEATMKTIRRTTKPCPNCREPIEKNDGCDHMKCRLRGLVVLFSPANEAV